MKTTHTKMIRTVAAAAIVSLMATPLMANKTQTHLDVGLSGNKLEYNSNQDYNWGVQLELSGTTSLDPAPGLRIGWNLGFEYYTLGAIESLDDSIGLNVDAMILGGYSFDDKFKVPIELMAGVGYGVGQIGKDYNSGLAYKGVASYDITKNFGIGVQYKHVDLSVVTLAGEFDSGLDIASVFLRFSK